MRACWLKWVGRDWSISADYIWLNYSGANINQKVGFRFITKFGEKGIINLGKMLPLAGGLIGGGVDVASTSIIAKNAIRMFMEGEDPDGTLPTEAEIESIEDVEVESDLL